MSCNVCHFADDGPDRRVGVAREARCAPCHRTAHLTAAQTWDLLVRSGQSCTTCHLFHNTDVIRTRAGDLSLAAMDRADEAHCAACHSPRGDMLALSEGHIAAAALYHGQAEVLDTVSPSGACLKCHDDESQSYWKGATLGGGIAIAEHASHPVGMTVQPGSGEAPRRLRDRIDARLPLFNGRMECQTCHLLTAKTVDLVVPFDEPYDMCLGCHRFPGRGADRKPQSPRLASRAGDVP